MSRTVFPRSLPPCCSTEGLEFDTVDLRADYIFVHSGRVTEVYYGLLREPDLVQSRMENFFSSSYNRDFGLAIAVRSIFRKYSSI